MKSANGTLNVKGKTEGTPVVVNAKNTKVTAAAPVDLDLKQTAECTIKNGAEGTNIQVRDGADAVVTNNIDKDVTIQTPDGETVVESGDAVDTVIDEETPSEPSAATTPSDASPATMMPTLR